MQSIFSSVFGKSSFEFILDSNFPQQELVTCVFCLLQNEDGNIWLTKNHRGWELPGGHIEPGENFEKALKREIMEEVGVQLGTPHLVGYKKVTNPEKEKNRHGGYYPFPHSYMLFFEATPFGEKVSPFPSGNDETQESNLFTEKEAVMVIQSENTKRILQSLLENK